MSGLTGLVDTLVADKLLQRSDLLRLPTAAAVLGPGPALAVEAVTNDVRILSDAARGRQMFSGNSPGMPVPNTASAAQAFSTAARAISAILANLPAAAGPAQGAAAVVPDRDAATPQALFHGLVAAVATSGVFYESHVAAFAAGLLDGSTLAREPQASWGAGVGCAMEAADSGFGRSDALVLDAKAAPTGPSRADFQALGVAQASLLVARQLEVLATGIFQWRGEAWAGVPMEWSLRERSGGQGAGETQAEGAPGWSTTLALTLPQLGQVTFRLSLSGSKLRASVAANEHASAPLRAGAGQLRQRLAAAGIEMPELAVSAWDKQ